MKLVFTLIFSDWGCLWFERTASLSSQVSENTERTHKVLRGGSLLKPDKVYLEIERKYEIKQRFNPRRNGFIYKLDFIRPNMF